jgi:hypothetical protein
MTVDVPSLSLKAIGGRKGFWNLLLYPYMLSLQDTEGSVSFDIARQELSEKLEIVEPALTKPMLVLRLDKKTMFLLEPDHLETIRNWLGPPSPEDLQLALKRRLRLSIPIGLVFLITSLPMAGDPDAGLEPIAFDPISACLGGSLILLGLIMKLWPRRELFILDALWLVLLAAKIAYDIFYGSHWLWALLILVLLFAAREGFRQFRRFKNIQSDSPLVNYD